MVTGFDRIGQFWQMIKQLLIGEEGLNYYRKKLQVQSRNWIECDILRNEKLRWLWQPCCWRYYRQIIHISNRHYENEKLYTDKVIRIVLKQLCLVFSIVVYFVRITLGKFIEIISKISSPIQRTHVLTVSLSSYLSGIIFGMIK